MRIPPLVARWREKARSDPGPFIALGLAVGGLVAFRLCDPYGFREIESKLRVGLTEREVVLLLGKEPLAYDRETAPANYYVDGWAFKQRPITHRVLIFFFGELICYVWLDAQGRVEDFFVGGS